MPPPSSPAVLPATVELFTSSVRRTMVPPGAALEVGDGALSEPTLIPPPLAAELLPEIVEFSATKLPALNPNAIPPPSPAAVFAEMVVFLTVSDPGPVACLEAVPPAAAFEGGQ